MTSPEAFDLRRGVNDIIMRHDGRAPMVTDPILDELRTLLDTVPRDQPVTDRTARVEALAERLYVTDYLGALEGSLAAAFDNAEAFVAEADRRRGRR